MELFRRAFVKADLSEGGYPVFSYYGLSKSFKAKFESVSDRDSNSKPKSL